MASGCIIWHGAVQSKGYPSVVVPGRGAHHPATHSRRPSRSTDTSPGSVHITAVRALRDALANSTIDRDEADQIVTRVLDALG